MFLKLNINPDERIGDGHPEFTEMLVNMDQVLTVSPHTGSAGKSKLRFQAGHTLLCGHSVDFILASVNDTLETGYKAPDPKDA
jgi:hypothetical protein